MLDGLKIVEIAEGLAGPLAALRLSELGANVVKVEPATGDYMRDAFPIAEGADVAAAFIDLNRGKRSIALGNTPRAAASVLTRLVQRADVLITDRTDVELAAIGLAAVAAASERGESKLIVVSITPWGRHGPLRNRNGSELTAQAMAGYTRYLGAHGQPARRLGADVASVGTGTFAAQAALAAIYARSKSGKGQRVDLSLTNSLLAMKSIHLAAQSNPDEYKGPRVGGANHPPELGWGARDSRVFMAFGGSVGPTGRAGWVDFVKEVGLEKLIDDPRCDKTGRVTTGHGARVHEMRETYEQAFAKYSAEELVALIRKHRGNASVYQRLDEALAHPQTKSLDLIDEVAIDGKVRRFRRFPARFSKLKPKSQTCAPGLGEHTREIALETGTSSGDLEALYQAGGLRRTAN
ncbi:MAG TPA: CoA transferase [Burkholderiales bacterium]|jgi:crotonobetainyl-CoA:carnitine CoA-transferase CaiB-like acyl-CoA transferase|nr:CoA transferase [Burkholderiales bacterium]